MSINSETASECEHLKKRDFELLGRVFDAEIRNVLPAQIGKSKAVASLHERGYIEPMKITLPGRFSVTIEGWNLTEAGRFIYCQNCADVNLDHPPETSK